MSSQRIPLNTDYGLQIRHNPTKPKWFTLLLSNQNLVSFHSSQETNKYLIRESSSECANCNARLIKKKLFWQFWSPRPRHRLQTQSVKNTTPNTPNSSYCLLLWYEQNIWGMFGLVFCCWKLSHVIFLKLRKKKLLSKLSKFTKWQLFSLKMVLCRLSFWHFASVICALAWVIKIVKNVSF